MSLLIVYLDCLRRFGAILVNNY